MSRLPLVALAVVLLLALPACGPSVDPAAKADLDRRLGELPTSPETYPPSDSYMPMAFQAGQWTRHRVTGGGEKATPQLLTYNLVGQDGGGYWLETVTESYYGREVAKMHVFMLGGRDPSAMEIRALRVKKNSGAPTDVDLSTDEAARAKYRHVLDLLAVSFEGQQKDDARVPGGHFIGCWRTRTPAPWGPWQSPSTLCAHPSVPLSGVVVAEPASGGPRLELVAFGSGGLESEL
jgi:hypothetical protein